MTQPRDPKDQVASKFDPSIQTEDIAFSPERLVTCEACDRQNPPNRAACIYCGGDLPIEANDLEDLRLVTRKLEPWEAGYNVILRSVTRGSTTDIEKASAILPDEALDLVSIVSANSPLPIARVESLKSAALIEAQLEPAGLISSIVSDEDLAPEKPPVRLSNIEITRNSFKFTELNTRSVVEIALDDLALIVVGYLCKTRTELLEKRRRKAEAKVIDETATAMDESVLDLYSKSDSRGYRVHLAGFDFSCLGDQKGMLAAENLRRLAALIAKTAPHAQVADHYANVRHLLNGIWDVESRSDPQGLKRSGFGKVEFGKVQTTSNLQQFNKYSRLQWHLL